MVGWFRALLRYYEGMHNKHSSTRGRLPGVRRIRVSGVYVCGSEQPSGCAGEGQVVVHKAVVWSAEVVVDTAGRQVRYGTLSRHCVVGVF